MLPNFIVAGVAKAGTTSLYYYLSQHPEVEIPRKETFYFARDFFKNAPGEGPPHFRDKSRLILDKSAYDKFYSECNKKAIGEISTCYYYFYKEAIPAIKQKLGDVKIIFLLRNPVERALSAYNHFYRDKSETLSLEDALKQEKSRMEKNWDFMWYYSALGFYADSAQAFKENFSHVKFVLSEDFLKEPIKILKEIFEFLGVDDAFTPDTSFRYNSSGSKKNNLLDFVSRNRFIKSAVSKISKSIFLEKKRMEMRQKLRTRSSAAIVINDMENTELKNIYLADIQKLQQVTGLNLNNWLK